MNEKSDEMINLLIKELRYLLELKNNSKRVLKFLEENYYKNRELCDEISILLTGKKVFELDEIDNYLFEIE